ncbi:ECF transporter S component [Enterococcus mediterraneensis]|uniref:ECF transporter S component n=1 Tax=Enterococcus mediterraneensis TaxID=2364791 RepID=UPI000F06236E|nr:ECF transporter S component [Enterococcus mediterraneensis]
MKKNLSTFDLVLTAIFLGILIFMGAIPFLGFIPIGPLNVTTMHIPVIIGSILLGPKLGGFLGGSFGIISLINATVRPSALSFVFSPFIPIIGTDHGSWRALIVVLVPRILIGIVPYFVYKGCRKLLKNKANTVSLMVAGVAGSMTNTILVMNLIYFLFKNAYGQLIGEAGSAVYTAILGVILTNGVPEAIVAALVTAAVGTVLLRLLKKNRTDLY